MAANHPINETLPDPWRASATGQTFRAWGKWQKIEIDLIDWQTDCRECGGFHVFTMRADHPHRMAAKMAVRWFGLCRDCRGKRAS